MALDIANLRLHRADSVMATKEHSRARRRGKERSAKHALDLKVLGVCSGSGLDKFDHALVHYSQDAPNAPLRVELLQVRDSLVRLVGTAC